MFQNSGHLYPWTSKQQGLILSSFYWGYVLTHIPGGILAERYGGKYVLGLGILCTAILTFITPFVIYATNGNWAWVVVVRVLEGLGEVSENISQIRGFYSSTHFFKSSRIFFWIGGNAWFC